MTGHRKYSITVSSFLSSVISERWLSSDGPIYKKVIGMLTIGFYRLNIAPVNGLWIPAWSGSIGEVY